MDTWLKFVNNITIIILFYKLVLLVFYVMEYFILVLLLKILILITSNNVNFHAFVMYCWHINEEHWDSLFFFSMYQNFIILYTVFLWCFILQSILELEYLYTKDILTPKLKLIWDHLRHHWQLVRYELGLYEYVAFLKFVFFEKVSVIFLNYVCYIKQLIYICFFAENKKLKVLKVITRGWSHNFFFKFNKNFVVKVFFKNVWFQSISIYNFFKSVFIPIFLMILYLFFTVFFFKVQLLKQISIWFILGITVFWLFSGFNFFIKRYQLGKFTTQVQRIWKRTNTYFWLVEFSLILLFSYYYLNSSQEPLYMYDYSSLNRDCLASANSIIISLTISSAVFYLMYFCLLRLNTNSWSQLILILSMISIFNFYLFFSESYQFYYVVSLFTETSWTLDNELNSWVLEDTTPNFRTKDQYTIVFLLLKYWHFVYIFLNWIFFLIKSFEKKKITYTLFCANFQSAVFVSGLTWISYLEIFKSWSRPFFDQPYFWFLAVSDNKFLFKLFNEINLFISNSLLFNNSLYNLLITSKSLLVWNVDNLAMWKFII